MKPGRSPFKVKTTKPLYSRFEDVSKNLVCLRSQLRVKVSIKSVVVSSRCVYRSLATCAMAGAQRIATFASVLRFIGSHFTAQPSPCDIQKVGVHYIFEPHFPKILLRSIVSFN